MGRNRTEKQREAIRRSQQKANQRTMSIPPAERRFADLLLERTADVLRCVWRLVAANPTLHRLVQSPEDVAACDTGCGTHP